MTERIAGAAILIGDLVITMPPPARHHTILHEMDRQGLDPLQGIPDRQGFVTDTGRFVRRREAAALAIEAAQITEPQWGAELYSEDLW